MFKRMWNWVTGKSRKEQMSEQQLTDLTRGMHHAASTTAAMIAQQYIRIIDQFFDSRPDGVLEAKMVKVQIAEGHYTMIPLISLVSPKGIALEKMRVEMSVRITETALKAATDNVDNSGATRASMKVQMAPKHKDNHGRRRDDLTEIEMVFTAGEPPEGIMRIIDDYTNMIKPMPEGPKDNGTDNDSSTYHTIGHSNPVNGTGNGDDPFPENPKGSALEPETPPSNEAPVVEKSDEDEETNHDISSEDLKDDKS